MIKIAVVYHSRSGYTKALAEHVVIGARSVGPEVRLMDCTQGVDWQYLDECAAIVFGSPTYMGSVSAELKGFMDSCSEVFIHKKWRNKIAAGFTTSTGLSGDKLTTLIQIAIFAFQLGMVWVGLDLEACALSTDSDGVELNRMGCWIGLMGQSSSGQGLTSPSKLSDRKTAEYFGRRVAELAYKLEK